VALARIHIEMDGCIIDGEGVVTAVGIPTGDPGPMIAEFLRSLSPGIIESMALTRQGLRGGGMESLTGDILAVAADIAEGRS